MSTLLAVLLALIVGFLFGKDSGEHHTYRLVIKECRELGGFFYGNITVTKCIVNDKTAYPGSWPVNINPPPTYAKPPAPPPPPSPHIPQPHPTTRY